MESDQTQIASDITEIKTSFTDNYKSLAWGTHKSLTMIESDQA